MKRKHYYLLRNTFIVSLSLLLFSCLISCNKDSITTDNSAKLIFDEDTISMDTVFVTAGSATKTLTIYNNNNQRINVSRIYLAGGEASNFRLNIDGIPTTQAENVEVWANDSLYVFVEVTIDPNDENTPYIVTDSIIFETNGNIQDVDLVAWGQNAHFYRQQIVCDETWTNDKPHVIYDYLYVDSLCTLTIEEGTKVHLHNSAVLLVDGTLKVNGGTDSTQIVSFQGTRLEYGFDGYYQKVPGQWGGLWFLQNSSNNEIRGALLRNGTVGIRVDPPSVNTGNPKLFIENTTIRDMYDTGITGIASDILGSNLVIFNCGRYNLQFEYGGQYAFLNSTFANYPTGLISEHKHPILRVSNYFVDANETVFTNPNTQAQFVNCIMQGSQDEEIEFDPISQEDVASGAVNFNFSFQNCLLKTEISADTSIFNIDGVSNNILNTNEPRDTIFQNYFNRDLRLKAFSPCVNTGLSNASISRGSANASPVNDITGQARDEQWDMGAFEFTE